VGIATVFEQGGDGFAFTGLGAVALGYVIVRYLVAGAEMPNHPRLRPVWNGTNYLGEPRFIYENNGAFERAWLAGAYRVAGDNEALDLIASGTVDLSREVVLSEEPTIEPVPPAESDSAQVVVEELGFNKIRIRTVSRLPSILVLSEVYYPDWKVEVDTDCIRISPPA